MFFLNYAAATNLRWFSENQAEGCFAKTIIYLKSTDKEGEICMSEGTAWWCG